MKRDVPTQKLDVTTRENRTTVLLPGCIPGATPYHHSIMKGTELTLEPGDFYHSTKTGGGVADPKAIGFHGHQWLFEAFLKALENGTEPEVSGESASKSVQIICAAYESARSGHPVKL